MAALAPSQTFASAAADVLFFVLLVLPDHPRDGRLHGCLHSRGDPLLPLRRKTG